MNRPFALKQPYGQALGGAVVLLTVGLLVQAVAGVIELPIVGGPAAAVRAGIQ